MPRAKMENRKREGVGAIVPLTPPVRRDRKLHPREQVAACAGRGQMTKRSKKTM